MSRSSRLGARTAEAARSRSNRSSSPTASPRHPSAVIVDGAVEAVRLIRRGGERGVLLVGPDEAPERHRVVFNGPGTTGADGILRREVIVDGWRIDVEIEPERRAALRARANRGQEAAARGGPTEVRAMIPGRIVAISVVAGDTVMAGQQILVVEAMKMQNELRAPRDGTVGRVAVGAGVTVEVGDLLLVLE